MLENVLKSISVMLGKALESKGPPEGETQVSLTYVQCAKTLLDETIEGMKKKEMPSDAPPGPGEKLTPAGEKAKEELMP
jgi:hypothetical protein